MTEAGLSSPTLNDLAILRWLTRCGPASPLAISAACGLVPAEVRIHLAWLETMRLASSRPDTDSKPARRVYYVTAERRRKTGISDVMVRDA